MLEIKMNNFILIYCFEFTLNRKLNAHKTNKVYNKN